MPAVPAPAVPAPEYPYPDPYKHILPDEAFGQAPCVQESVSNDGSVSVSGPGYDAQVPTSEDGPAAAAARDAARDAAARAAAARGGLPSRNLRTCLKWQLAHGI